MIHHSALSFRKLTSMKIVDRSSCYIVGIKKDMADKALLAKYELFGRFGDILSIRIIQDKDPCEVYIRFATQASALRAIDWCNSTASLFMNAKHGYQKYCIKFINGQNCKRSNINCPNRHSWADTKDILTFKNSRLVPNAVVSNSVEEDNEKLSPKRGVPTEDQTDAQEKMRHDIEMRTLQNQFLSLQKQYAKQSHFVNDLVVKMQELQRENKELYVRFCPQVPQRGNNCNMNNMNNCNMNQNWMQQSYQQQVQMQQNFQAQFGQQCSSANGSCNGQVQAQRGMNGMNQIKQQSSGNFMSHHMTNFGANPMANGMKNGTSNGMSNGMNAMKMKNGVRAPFVVNSPELKLMASYQPLPEHTPLPESVMNHSLNDIVDQVIQSDQSNYSTSRSSTSLE